MGPDRFGLMTEGNEEATDAGVQQGAHHPFRKGQSEHSGQGFRCLGLWPQPRS